MREMASWVSLCAPCRKQRGLNRTMQRPHCVWHSEHVVLFMSLKTTCCLWKLRSTEVMGQGRKIKVERREGSVWQVADLEAGTRSSRVGMLAAGNGKGRLTPEKLRTAGPPRSQGSSIHLSTSAPREPLRITALMFLIAKWITGLIMYKIIYIKGQGFMVYILKGFFTKWLKFDKRHEKRSMFLISKKKSRLHQRIHTQRTLIKLKSCYLYLCEVSHLGRCPPDVLATWVLTYENLFNLEQVA